MNNIGCINVASRLFCSKNDRCFSLGQKTAVVVCINGQNETCCTLMRLPRMMLTSTRRCVYESLLLSLPFMSGKHFQSIPLILPGGPQVFGVFLIVSDWVLVQYERSDQSLPNRLCLRSSRQIHCCLQRRLRQCHPPCWNCLMTRVGPFGASPPCWDRIEQSVCP